MLISICLFPFLIQYSVSLASSPPSLVMLGLEMERQGGLGALYPCNDDDSEADNSHDQAKDHQKNSLETQAQKTVSKITQNKIVTI